MTEKIKVKMKEFNPESIKKSFLSALNFRWKNEDGDSLRAKALRVLACFIVLMMVLTVLSRGVHAMSLPSVTTTRPTSGSISHTVEGQGSVAQNLEEAIYTVSGLRIGNVYVKEGESVEAGDKLFAIDMEDLAEQILEKEKAIEQSKLELESGKSSESVANTKKNTDISRAREDYGNTQSSADKSINEAYNEMIKARDELNKHLASQSDSSGGSDAVLATLENTLTEKENAFSAAEAALRDMEARRAAAATEARNQAGTEEEKQQAEDQVYQQYAADISAKENDVRSAKEAKEEAEAAVSDYQQTLASAAAGAFSETESSLRAAYESAKSAYEKAADQKEDDLLAAKRALEDATAADAIDNSNKVKEISMDLAELELEKLYEIQKKEGVFTADAAAVVTAVGITTGERTTDGTAVRLADISSGSKFTAQIPKTNEKYVQRGYEAELLIGSSTTPITGLTVDSVTENSNDSDLLDVVVQLPADAAQIGNTGTLKIKNDAVKYDLVVPLDVLHPGDTQDKYYVLVLQESDGILGTQNKVERIDVTLQDKNDTMAALTPDNITSSQEIVVNADKDVEAGDTVRLNQ